MNRNNSFQSYTHSVKRHSVERFGAVFILGEDLKNIIVLMVMHKTPVKVLKLFANNFGQRFFYFTFFHHSPGPPSCL